MKCGEFEQRLEAFFAAATTAAERAALETHGASCPPCGSLLAALRGGADDRSRADQDAFVAALLPRTAGSPCKRAQSALPDWVDGELGGDDWGLVALHLEHCGGCSALAAALQALRLDLPALATVEPDASFTADVVTATGAVWRSQPSTQDRATGWRQLLARPRFAWEFATAACSLLMALYALPSSPLRPLPQQAMAVVRMDVVGLLQAATVRLEPFADHATARTWDASGGRLAGAVRGWAETFASEHTETAAAWSAVQNDFTEVGAGIKSRNLAQMSHALQELGNSLQALFRGTAPTAAPG